MESDDFKMALEVALQFFPGIAGFQFQAIQNRSKSKIKTVQ